MMFNDEIIIRGAKEHNLKNIDVRLPRFKLVVITGVSGSGKSSLAFDTLYAEGQRRYVESLSAYARQFIGQMEKPKVDFIGGLSPAIAIEQKAVSKNPRSTVATVTEIYDYLRVLFARLGTPHCPQCGREVRAQSAQEIVAQVAALPAGTAFMLLSPLARNRKGTFQDTFAEARASGFSRVRVDGSLHGLDEKITLDKKKKHTIELVVDRLAIPPPAIRNDRQQRREFITRLTDSIETALRMSEGQVTIDPGDGGELPALRPQRLPGLRPELSRADPRHVQLQLADRACARSATGWATSSTSTPTGSWMPEKSLLEGGVRPWGELGKKAKSGTYKLAEQIVAQYRPATWTRPGASFPKTCRNAILYGGVHYHLAMGQQALHRADRGQFEGVFNAVRRRYKQTKSEWSRQWYTSFMSQQPCPACHGQRLRPESAAVTVGGQNHDRRHRPEHRRGAGAGWRACGPA